MSPPLKSFPVFYTPAHPPMCIPVLFSETATVTRRHPPNPALPTVPIARPQPGPPLTARSSTSRRLSSRNVHPQLLPMAPPIARSCQSSLSHRARESQCPRLKSLSKAEDRIGLIPKPQGEAGRPGCGGYGLCGTLQQLGWDKLLYEEVKVCLQSLATFHCDSTEWLEFPQ